MAGGAGAQLEGPGEVVAHLLGVAGPGLGRCLLGQARSCKGAFNWRMQNESITTLVKFTL